MINPLIHHPSFYGLSSSSQVPVQTTRPVEPEAPRPARPPLEIRPMIFHQRTLNVLFRSSPNQSVPQGKISLREILKKFAFEIDYETFFQWCQTNALIPLLELDEQERKIVPLNEAESVFIDQTHLDRCLDLLNDLKGGLISMTLLPSAASTGKNQIRRFVLSRATFFVVASGAKKRKSTITPSRTEKAPADVSPVPIVQNENEEVEDDQMPVVASVEESPLPVVIVATADAHEEKIHFDEATSKPTEKIVEQENDSSSAKKVRVRSRSTRSRRAKRHKPIVENDHDESSSLLQMKLITEQEIDQYLRTLFTSNGEKSPTRTQLSSTNSSVFDILTSATTNETSNLSSTVSESSSFSGSTARTTEPQI